MKKELIKVVSHKDLCELTQDKHYPNIRLHSSNTLEQKSLSYSWKANKQKVSYCRDVKGRKQVTDGERGKRFKGFS